MKGETPCTKVVWWYFFAKDKKAGDVNGQAFVHFGGAWWVVSAAGLKITAKR